jgi:hypothetical protein
LHVEPLDSQKSGLVKNQNQPQSIVRSNLSMPYFPQASITRTILAQNRRASWWRWCPVQW